MAEEEKPKSDSLVVKAIAAVFLTVLAPILVAFGPKYLDKLSDKLFEPAKTNDAQADAANSDSTKSDGSRSGGGKANGLSSDSRDGASSNSTASSSASSASATADNADFALLFDGNAYVTLPKQLTYDGNTAFTIEARIFPAMLDHMTIVCDAEAGGVTLEMREDGVLFSVHAGGKYVHARSDEFLAPDKSLYLAGVTDRKQVMLFINGKKVSSIPADLDQFRPSTRPFLIGANPDAKGGVTSPFVGRIDEVRISRVARYATDYTPQPRLDADKDTLALYHFDQGSGDTLLDSSRHKYHAQITGAKWIYTNGKAIKSAAGKPSSSKAKPKK